MPPKIPPLNRQRRCPRIFFGGPFANPALRRVGLGHLAVGGAPRGPPRNGSRWAASPDGGAESPTDGCTVAAMSMFGSALEHRPMVRRVVVVPHDPSWADEFCRVSAEVSPAFGPNLVALHHVGSTSIPGIYAKPIIDMLAAVRIVAAVDQLNGRFDSLGYVPKGEFGIPGRRYFYRNNVCGVRVHQIHAFDAVSLGVVRHLAFRDYLIAHPQIASSYSDLKRGLAAAHPEDIEAYMDGKDSFIKDVEAKALAWAADRRLVAG